jgi:hypothetical protein
MTLACYQIRQAANQLRSVAMASIQAPPPPLPTRHPAFSIQSPVQADTHPMLEQAVLHIQRTYRPDSSNKIYDGRSMEYFQYCEQLYPNDLYAKVLDAQKVYKFMFYQTFRSQKKRGGKRALDDAVAVKFDKPEYDKVISKYQAWMMGNAGAEPAEPLKPVMLSTIDQYKAVFSYIHKQQVAKRVNGLVWDQIWTLPLKELYRLVKNRRGAVKKANYEEKMEAEFAPHAAADKLDKIEHELWMRGRKNHRSAGTWLRHRYSMMHTTGGVLRCESLYGAELSDFLALTLQRKEDPHPLLLMITQLALGEFSTVFSPPKLFCLR